jgi:hypothetical protein
MSEKKNAGATLKVRRILTYIAIVTVFALLFLKVLKETTRVPVALPLMTPLPGTEDSDPDSFVAPADGSEQTTESDSGVDEGTHSEPDASNSTEENE